MTFYSSNMLIVYMFNIKIKNRMNVLALSQIKWFGILHMFDRDKMNQLCPVVPY